MENKLLEALKEISKGEGAFDVDQLEHASNCIENMKSIANEAILEYEKLTVPRPSISERYPKDCVLHYEDGWYITFKSLSGNIIKSHGAYKTKEMAEPDRRILNA